MARTVGGERLGTFYQIITLTGPSGRALSFEGLVDTGAHFSVVPAATLRELGVRPIGRIPVRFADGQTQEWEFSQVDAELLDMRRPVLVFFGEEGAPILIGAHTLEALLLDVDVVEQRLVPKEALLM
jgi:aspartyl protease family protein